MISSDVSFGGNTAIPSQVPDAERGSARKRLTAARTGENTKKDNCGGNPCSFVENLFGTIISSTVVFHVHVVT